MKKYKAKYNSVISIFAIIAMIAMNLGLISNVEAAYITSMKDTHSTIKAATTADHTITFTLASGNTFATGEYINVDFDAGYLIGSTFVAGDFTFNDGTLRTIIDVDQGAGTTTVDACTGAVNNVGVAVDTTAKAFRVIACPSYTASGATASVTFTIAGTAGDGTLTNPAAGTYAYTITAAGDDATSGQAAIITDDIVAVTATVSPSLTFSISDNAIGFGALSSSAATWANGAATGSATDTSAHNLIIATNAATGYAITYNGATLTNGSHTITVAAGATGAGGTPGGEQFGMGFSISGTGTVAANYLHSTPVWTFVASTTTGVVSHTAPAASTTISAYYLANISTITEPGSYSTAITYIATGIF